MTKAIFDEELEKRDAVIEGLLTDNARLNSEMSILNNETTVKCKSLKLIQNWRKNGTTVNLNIQSMILMAGKL